MKTYLADANIFLRFLRGDSLKQLAEAKEYFQQAKTGEIKVIVTTVVFFEVIYVLDHNYKVSRLEIGNGLGDLLTMPFLEFEEHSLLKTTLISWVGSNLDMVDCYLKAKAENLDAKILTFDKKLVRK